MAGMDKVEGLMKKLKLSKTEKKGVKIGWTGGGKGGAVEPQALGKLLSEKPAFADGIAAALGQAWCPMRGVDCKGLGDNIFLFTFHQSSGKRKALEEGPWLFDNDALVMEDFDACKRIEEYEFGTIPIWVRLFNIPLGLMSRQTGEAIGKKIGEAVEVDVGEDGMAVGQFMRVNVRIRVDGPLMRGLTLDLEKDEKSKRERKGGKEEEEDWCRFEYEFLPTFCYTCGIIGHTDRSCELKLKKGEEAQYSR